MKLSVGIEIREGGRGEDRAAGFEAQDSWVFVVADGAGGVGGGAFAAECVVRATEKFADGVYGSPAEALLSVDVELSMHGCMSTGAIVEVRKGFIRGASCGDSAVWLIGEEGVWELTEHQFRKPLLGAGGSPVSFEGVHFQGTLLLASDGLLNYVPRMAILSASLSGTAQVAANTLAELARLSSGTYQDDVAVIIARANV